MKKLISKRKLIRAVQLFEDKIDDTINSIRIYSSNSYEIKGYKDNYIVDVQNNKVSKVYPDPE